jgi:hypothetical protein
MLKELIYPFFIECCKHTIDPYWKSIFEDLAYGITPYSTYISKDMIICNYKDKEFVYKIQKKPSNILYEEVSTIFRTKLKLLSPSEILSNKNDIIFLHENNIYNDWSSIKKKNIKETIVENFAINMKNKYSLSANQTKYLIDVIFLALIFHILLPSDIYIEKGTIKEINGITFENKQVILDFEIYDIEHTAPPDIVIETNLMSENWDRFLANLRKLKSN